MKHKIHFKGNMGVLVVVLVLFLIGLVLAVTAGPAIQMYMVKMGILTQPEAPKTSQEYYDMFLCPCCGKSIATECCGMAKQRRDYVNNLMLEGKQDNELVYEMVKRFGLDSLESESQKEEIQDYMSEIAPQNPAQLELSAERYDFGKVSQSDGVVSTTFTVTNAGKNNLIIENLDTSCMCTTASLTYDGKEGPVFGMSMHGSNPQGYSLVIPPGDSAELNVYYDPLAHGKQDKPEMDITREVTIVSNDPDDFQKKVKITLKQVP